MTDDDPCRWRPVDGWNISSSSNRPFVGVRPDIILPATVVAITIASLFARVVDLGGRVAHWDEGRVAYWTLRYLETGAWEYHPIVHGPFLPQINYHIFSVLGPSDFSSRLIVALIGGILPLAAVLFRERLRDSEVVILAVLLATNPILLYYSRFMRNDVVLAALMLFAFGFFVRAYDTRNPWMAHVGILLVAIGFTTMGNAILYLVSWAGALVLIVDHRLFRARHRSEVPVDLVRRYVTDTLSDLWKNRFHLLLASGYVFGLLVWFYAPRAGDRNVIGIDRVGTDPTMAPAVVHAAILENIQAFVSLWIASDMQAEPLYLDAFVYFLTTLYHGAFILCVLSIIGFIADRYAPDGPRDIVAIATYWGLFSIVGYPLAMDILSPWTTVHAIVPLAIPAAVGGAVLVRRGREVYVARGISGAVIGGLIVVLIVAIVGGGVVGVYTSAQSQDNPLVQYAQPAGDMKGTLGAVERAVANNDGELDIVYYDDQFYLANESFADYKPVIDPTHGSSTSGWFNRVPLPWYTEKYGASVASARTETTLDELLDENPPVVIAPTSQRVVLDDRLDGHTAAEYELRLWGHETVIYIDEGVSTDG